MNDDLVFEMELIKQVEINIDFVIDLIKKYYQDHNTDKEILVDINKAIDSSIELRNKKDLINQFISNLDIHANVDEDWHKFVETKKLEELDQIIDSENLDRESTYKFINNAFRDGTVETTGTSITKIMLAKPSRFSSDGLYTRKRESVLDKLAKFFERFFNISNKEF